MTAPNSDTLRAMHADMLRGSVSLRATVDPCDPKALQAWYDLVLAAPALLQEVLALRAEVQQQRESRAKADGDAEYTETTLSGCLRAVEAQRDRLQAIIDGRAVPPTAEEIDAHHAAGGAWFVRAPWRNRAWYVDTAGVDVRGVWQEGAVCIALDAERKPCDWPVVVEGGV